MLEGSIFEFRYVGQYDADIPKEKWLNYLQTVENLGLHCLPVTRLGVSSLQWVNRYSLPYFKTPSEDSDDCTQTVQMHRLIQSFALRLFYEDTFLKGMVHFRMALAWVRPQAKALRNCPAMTDVTIHDG